MQGSGPEELRAGGRRWELCRCLPHRPTAVAQLDLHPRCHQVDVVRPAMPLVALALTVVLCAVPVAQVGWGGVGREGQRDWVAWAAAHTCLKGCWLGFVWACMAQTSTRLPCPQLLILARSRTCCAPAALRPAAPSCCSTSSVTCWATCCRACWASTKRRRARVRVGLCGDISIAPPGVSTSARAPVGASAHL